jgi:hypothetical protein
MKEKKPKTRTEKLMKKNRERPARPSLTASLPAPLLLFVLCCIAAALQQFRCQPTPQQPAASLQPQITTPATPPPAEKKRRREEIEREGWADWKRKKGGAAARRKWLRAEQRKR